jgi:hypothetical protein
MSSIAMSATTVYDPSSLSFFSLYTPYANRDNNEPRIIINTKSASSISTSPKSLARPRGASVSSTTSSIASVGKSIELGRTITPSKSLSTTASTATGSEGKDVADGEKKRGKRFKRGLKRWWNATLESMAYGIIYY